MAENRGGLESTIEITFEDVNGKTRVSDRTQYRVPIPLLGKVAERFLHKTNENETEIILANLKAKMESEGA